MCSPIALGIASLAMGAASSIQQGQAAQQAAEANARAMEENARLANEQASLTEQKKARDLSILQQQEQQAKGTQRVAGAGSGVDMSYGSGLNILASTALTSKEDQNAVEWNTAGDKWALQSQAAQYTNQANQQRAAGKNAANAGYMGALTSVASGAYSMMGGGTKAPSTSSTTANPAGVTNSFGTFGTVAPKWVRGQTFRR